MGCNAITRFMVTFHGKEAHAAAAPELGLNALDAVMLLFHGINAWRQQLPEVARIHGVVKEGGVMPNIIPGRASCVFYLRAPNDAMVTKMATHFRAIARGAAMMTGTRVSIKPWLEQYQARKPNQPLNDVFVEAARAVGLPTSLPPHPVRASSDFGNVSHVVPGIHPSFSIARTEIPGHSIPFRDAAGSAFGRQQMLKAAAALARVGWRFLSDAQFRAAVRNDFLRS
jgi:metal-dependent amidase/aminoacylase/carboxypeptidase family protein